MKYKKVALVACSNGLLIEQKVVITQLIIKLQEMGLEVIESPCIYTQNKTTSCNAKERAHILNAYFSDDTIDAIFDISGGDMANEILPFLDYNVITKSKAIFFGYSDLTTVINAIYTKANKSCILYQVKNLIWDTSSVQISRFQEFLSDTSESPLFEAKWTILNGNGDVKQMIQDNIVVGGNIRCLLKLAGTSYFPNIKDKILFLEARSGSVPQISTYMAQLYQMGVFDKVKGILLGTFTQMKKEQCTPTAYEILKEYLPKDCFVAQTSEIGHDILSKAIKIG